jgi:hypothetical protein
MMSIIEDLLTTIILRGRKLTTLSLKKISPRYDLKSQKLSSSIIHLPDVRSENFIHSLSISLT